ncbi:CDP-glycerol glycerophosphotransferase [Spirochaeta isovalerica]|uniref:CDP-glycerol glycerophosphotransferase n=1 Tax=Spirochaeta isovalerica TaxID=150 RepID=A0A841REH9_9SPIO|nr:CDP-glycerol glycerophosphotransferase [Spirochaeta isovalerica]
MNRKIGPYFIETKSFRGMWFVLKAGFWFTSSMETPVGGLLHRWKRTVVHLGHGAPLKNIGLLEKNISFVKRVYYKLITGNFTWFLAVSDYFKPIIANFAGVSEKRVLVNEQPRNQVLLNQQRDVLKDYSDNFRILYAPTWKPWVKELDWGMLEGENFEAIDNFLFQNNAVLFIRMHPYFEKAEVYERAASSKSIKVLSSENFPEVNDVLGAFDALITDYSSVCFDYLLFDRPILFWTKDIDKYEIQIGFTDSFEKLAAGPAVSAIGDLLGYLRIILESEENLQKFRIPVLKLIETDRSNVCKSLLEKVGV